MKFTGYMYIDGQLRKGTMKLDGGEYEFIEGISNDGLYGTLIPMPVNAHTHLGDSFIGEEPAGTLPEIVGPGGLKHRRLKEASNPTKTKYMGQSNKFMEDNGTISYFDFREEGIQGIKNLKNSYRDFISPVIFGRCSNNTDNIDNVLTMSNGIGISSISDIDYDEALDISSKTHRRNKIVAMHFSENKREDIDKVINLNPDILVHGIEAKNEDLDIVHNHKIPIVITPRSNIFYGKRPNYKKFINQKIDLMIGTDNVFVTEPDIFSEMDFLYRYQRFTDYISPKTILRMAIDNPRKFMENNTLKVREKYIFFKNELLNEYQLITKKHYFASENITHY